MLERAIIPYIKIKILLWRKPGRKKEMLTVPSVTGRVDDSGRMRSEANKINPILFAVYRLHASDPKSKSLIHFLITLKINQSS